MIRYLLSITLILILAACAQKNAEPEYVERSVNDLYAQARSDLVNGNPNAAAESFEEVERQHPHSSWAIHSQILAAYSYYLSGSYDEASLTLDRFIELNPSSDYAAYAYYLRAIIHYAQIGDVERDQKSTFLALEGMDQVLERYGDSVYARDASLKRDLILDHLAGKEVEVGLFYLRNDEYSASINRFRNVITNFPTTTHVPEALARLVEAYVALGLFVEAEQHAAVLQYNFPNDYWYEYSHSLLASVGHVEPQLNPIHINSVKKKKDSDDEGGFFSNFW